MRRINRHFRLRLVARGNEQIHVALSPRRWAPFELLSPLGVVIFPKEPVELRGSDGDYSSRERRSMCPRRAEALMILKWMRVMCRPFRFSPSSDPSRRPDCSFFPTSSTNPRASSCRTGGPLILTAFSLSFSLSISRSCRVPGVRLPC